MRSTGPVPNPGPKQGDEWVSENSGFLWKYTGEKWIIIDENYGSNNPVQHSFDFVDKEEIKEFEDDEAFDRAMRGM